MVELAGWMALGALTAVVTRGALAPVLIAGAATLTVVGRSADVLLPRLDDGDAYRALVLGVTLTTGAMLLLTVALLMTGRAFLRRYRE